MLQAESFKFACFGSFNAEWIRQLRDIKCDYPLSIMVPKNTDPLVYIEDIEIDIIHICWRNAANSPDALITDKLLDALSDYQIVLWDEDRAEIIKRLLSKNLMGICSNRPEMLKPYKQNPDHPIDIVCHRGSNKLAAENTIEAAEICFNQKMRYVEIDVRTTHDGELVVHHDIMLDRTTNGTGMLADHTLSELKKLDASSWFRKDFSNDTIPTLAEFLAFAQKKNKIYIEIKNADPIKVLNLVEQFDMLQDYFFWSADIKVLIELRRQLLEIILMASRCKFSSLEDAIASYGTQIIEFNAATDDLSEIKQCTELGVKSMIFSLKFEWPDLLNYLDHKPDLVNLNCADKFKIIASYPLVYNHFQTHSRI